MKLERGAIASNTDQRIANLIVAFSAETAPEAATTVWVLRCWQAARAALVAVKEVAEDTRLNGGVRDELLEIVEEGLDTLGE